MLSIVLIFASSSAFSQDLGESKFDFKGYLKYLTTVNFRQVDEAWITDNLIHNRLEFRYYPSSKWKTDLEFRNRFFYGESVTLYNKTPGLPSFDELISQDYAYFDLSWTWAKGQSYLINTTVDRLFVDYTSGDWQITVGRQRINWGQNLIWNPNDVFNAYSYFDFDYEERPGTDAVRVQYFTGSTSSAEFVWQMGDSIDDMSFMGLYRFSKWNYDIQFLAGLVKNDLAFGTGWSGDIKGGGFRGEFTYFHNKDSLSDPVGQLVGSVSGDYTFPNSLYLQVSFLFNSTGTTGNAGSRNPLEIRQTSAKVLTLSKLDLFGEVAYQISPLWRADVASIMNPFDKSYFVSPSLAYSVSDNIELMLIAQLFSGAQGTEFGGLGKYFFFRFKWSF
jgi:hypothetical protein